MTQNPYIQKFIDDEERELYDAIETGSVSEASPVSSERKLHLQGLAKNTINEERQQISLRVSKSDLARLKAIALRQGIPYQTVLNSLIHRYVSESSSIK